MANHSNHNLANPAVWIRLLYMIVFWFLLVFARFAVGLLAVLQALLVLLTGAPNEHLRGMGGAIGVWTLQAMRFLTFSSDDKPFPFQDWPVVEEDAPVADQTLTAADSLVHPPTDEGDIDTPHRSSL